MLEKPTNSLDRDISSPVFWINWRLRRIDLCAASPSFRSSGSLVRNLAIKQRYRCAVRDAVIEITGGTVPGAPRFRDFSTSVPVSVRISNNASGITMAEDHFNAGKAVHCSAVGGIVLPPAF